jgi:hypothetical protein
MTDILAFIAGAAVSLAGWQTWRVYEARAEATRYRELVLSRRVEDAARLMRERGAAKKAAERSENIRRHIDELQASMRVKEGAEA